MACVFIKGSYPVELSHEQVRGIAELAKLDLTDDEVALYAGQLSHILQYFERLQALDTTQIEPTASVLPLKNVLREDVAGTPLDTADVIANAPDTQDNQFRVSAILGDE
ncbi:MAG: Asp-tRNA(Asn)/Glu-tRNA(Gln) amidotransferase subunit GatC [Anaerolineae bacterium]|nr:Asp-tRNA(Asn)/Glu-tRNA(Gln) amidotransferase subunit GatC [Anaerolineae bacterium]